MLRDTLVTTAAAVVIGSNLGSSLLPACWILVVIAAAAVAHVPRARAALTFRW